MLDQLIESYVQGNFPSAYFIKNAYLEWEKMKAIDKEFCLGCSEIEYQILAGLVSATRPQTILEIGPGMGASGFSMLGAAPYSATLQQVDILDAQRGKFLIGEREKPRVKSFTGTSDAFFEQNSQHFNFIFIDGMHMDPEVSRDIANSLKFRTTGAVIVAHDIFHKDLEHIGVALKNQAAGADKLYAEIKTGGNGFGIIY